jgi:hypothetical protein
MIMSRLRIARTREDALQLVDASTIHTYVCCFKVKISNDAVAHWCARLEFTTNDCWFLQPC